MSEEEEEGGAPSMIPITPNIVRYRQLGEQKIRWGASLPPLASIYLFRSLASPIPAVDML